MDYSPQYINKSFSVKQQPFKKELRIDRHGSYPYFPVEMAASCQPAPPGLSENISRSQNIAGRNIDGVQMIVEAVQGRQMLKHNRVFRLRCDSQP